MVLGTSDVRLLDMTRAFASVANKGVAVTPYGITRVIANGETIYTHEVDRSHVLVAPYVAAEMTDLLQTAVNTGTGRAAQIGRPVAGKTGTTSSNKDGWFLGFSSGLTTGVWMGRDNARPIAGLHGGTAPAQAWAAFMKPATASRPIEQFETQVTLPEWQLEPDEESYFGDPDNGQSGQLVDPDGNPLPPAGQEEREPRTAPPETAPAQPEPSIQDLIDRATGEPSRPGPSPSPRALPPRSSQDDRPTQ